MNISKIQELMIDNGIEYCIISNINDSKVKVLGELDKLVDKDLPKQLFRDSEAINNLNNSLEGQEMPVTWKQGKVKGIVCKPKSNIIIGLFYNEHRSLIDSIDFCNEINAKVLNVF